MFGAILEMYLATAEVVIGTENRLIYSSVKAGRILYTKQFGSHYKLLNNQQALCQTSVLRRPGSF